MRQHQNQSQDQSRTISPPVSTVALGCRHAVIVLLLLAGCAGEAPEPALEPKPVRVENAALGIVLADLPELFVVAQNEGETLRLTPVQPAVDPSADPVPAEGELTVHVRTPEVGGVNLVAAWQAHKQEIEAMPEGEYQGQNELVTQLGPAFYSRGRYTADGGARVEQTKVFTLHPSADAMLELSYLYPAGNDTVSRLQDQLFVVLGAVEALPVGDVGDVGDAGGKAATEAP